MRKTIAWLVVLTLLFSFASLPVFADQNEKITVLLNGQELNFDVDPVLMNDRTLVPMRAIFEALGAKVNWNDENETASGTKNNTRVSVSIGSNVATVNGKATALDQSAVLKDDRTLVPLRFISESFDCEVGWDDPTQTVTIQSDESAEKSIYFINPYSFDTLGGWSNSDTFVVGKSNPDPVPTVEETTDDAIANVNIKKAGTYDVWVWARDYATNQPGTRYYNIAVDGERSPERFGDHGKEGFFWEKAGTYNFTEGIHSFALQDTSSFFARCQGILITGDLGSEPSLNIDDYAEYIVLNNALSEMPSANYPQWANEEMASVTKTETIENDNYKLVFYQGTGRRGEIVQSETYIKINGEWVLSKTKNEDLGVLALRADDTQIRTKRMSVPVLSSVAEEKNNQTVTLNGETFTATTGNYYQMGIPSWLLPSSMEVKEDGSVVLYCSNAYADATITYSFDSVTVEPKVTFEASIKQDGAYSFTYFNGAGVEDDSFERVTAPFLFTKGFIPDEDIVYAEYDMFTPMNTFTFDNNGQKLSKGVVVDPTCVQQDVARPTDSDFGILFRTPNGTARPQLVAPLFAQNNSIMKAGDSYSFSYRIVNNPEDWYENYVHVAQDIYNCVDLRTNYFASINDVIYNTTDLLMDDLYGGWDDKDMGYYNMEAKMVTSQSNLMELAQRYLLTENEEILDERVIPTMAYLMTRGGPHFKRIEGDNSYTASTPTKLSGPSGNSNVFSGLYMMTQGRVPVFLKTANETLTKDSQVGVSGNAQMYMLTGDENFKQNVITAADNYITNVLHSEKFANTMYINGFVPGDGNPMLSAFVTAYELTGDQKYLDAMRETSRYIMTTLWTTGYQNDYATTDYTVEPEKVESLMLENDTANWYYHKDGVQWRIGNPFGINTKAAEAQNKVQEESAPGWLVSRAGMSTEHLMTPSNGNAITMNMWPGTALRAANYTDEEFVRTQARNAIVGRFGNYGGYYWERNLFHIMKEDYPYNGPDYALIYWHHIPVFLAMIEDFLINNVWDKSDGKISFPTATNSGYAYFVSNQYGFDSGKFYDEDDMWLWLDRGICEPSTDEVDYITAKKDGTLGIALVNEGNNEVTTTVKLGEKIPNSASYTETATLYDKDGNKSSVEIVNGQFTVTIPAKGIQSVVLHPDVKTPAFAKKDYMVSQTLGNTVSSFTNGKAYLFQFNDQSYSAYLYTDLMAADITNAEFKYTIGNGKEQAVNIDSYPFETIVKVEDPSQEFKFTVTVTKTDGSKQTLGSGTLRPIQEAEKKPYEYGKVEVTAPYYKPFTTAVNAIGCDSAYIRFVVPKPTDIENFAADTFIGGNIRATLTNKSTGEKMVMTSVVSKVELRGEDQIVISAAPEGAVALEDYGPTHKAELTVAHPNDDIDKVAPADGSGTTVTPTPTPSQKPTTPPTGNVSTETFDPFALTYTLQGMKGTDFRFVLKQSLFPFTPTEANVVGLKIKGTITTPDKKTLPFESEVKAVEFRDDGSMVLVVPETADVKASAYGDVSKGHKFDLQIHPAK